MRNQLLIIILILPLMCSAQQWKRYKKEYVFGLGATNFLGDLGGANQVGTDYFKDLEFSLTRPQFSFGYRYRLNQSVYVKGGFYYGRLGGDDKLTSEPARNNRNLSFRSNIYEISGEVQYTFVKEKSGHRYQIKGVKGWRNINIQSYLFAGVGVFYFNPKGQYNNVWWSLQKFGTEGQGLIPGTKKYSRINICIPLGIGVSYAINRTLSIGLEYGLRKTFTDYIDDVSGDYYDKSKMRTERGEIAAYFVDPSSGANPTWTQMGEQRGDPKDKDSYMFAIITLSQKIKPKRTKAKF